MTAATWFSLDGTQPDVSAQVAILRKLRVIGVDTLALVATLYRDQDRVAFVREQTAPVAVRRHIVRRALAKRRGPRVPNFIAWGRDADSRCARRRAEPGQSSSIMPRSAHSHIKAGASPEAVRRYYLSHVERYVHGKVVSPALLTARRQEFEARWREQGRGVSAENRRCVRETFAREFIGQLHTEALRLTTAFVTAFFPSWARELRVDAVRKNCRRPPHIAVRPSSGGNS